MSFSLPRIYPIIDAGILQARGIAPIAFANTLLGAGAKTLQYRHKEVWTEDRFEEAATIAETCRSAGALFVVNDRADFAALLDAGVHVGQDDLPPSAARVVVGHRPIGYSTHNRRQLMNGDEQDVEYLAIGPIFPTSSKLNPDPAIGVAGLRSLRPLTSKPLVAIGGITLANAEEVLIAGADSIAVIGGFLPASSSLAEAGRLAQEWYRLLP